MTTENPKLHGWKEGVASCDICSGGAALAGKEPEHKKGSIVRYKRYKQTDENCRWTGNYEWHYLDQTNFNLVRSTKLLIEK